MVGWKQTKRYDSPCRNEVQFLERQLHSEKLSFVHKKETEHSIEFLFPSVSFIGVFSNLKCKTLALKTTTWWTHTSHFVDGWHLLRCQIRFFPHPLNGWHDHWTFVGEWGMGDFTDLVCIGRTFSQTSLKLEFFSLYNFFSALYVMSDNFFSAGYFSPRNLFACFFPLEISLQDIFSEITHNPLKSQMVGP